MRRPRWQSQLGGSYGEAASRHDRSCTPLAGTQADGATNIQMSNTTCLLGSGRSAETHSACISPNGGRTPMARGFPNFCESPRWLHGLAEKLNRS